MSAIDEIRKYPKFKDIRCYWSGSNYVPVQALKDVLYIQHGDLLERAEFYFKFHGFMWFLTEDYTYRRRPIERLYEDPYQMAWIPAVFALKVIRYYADVKPWVMEHVVETNTVPTAVLAPSSPTVWQRVQQLWHWLFW